MATDAQVDAATDAYLKARGWSDDMIAAQAVTRAEIKARMVEALAASEKAADVQNP